MAHVDANVVQQAFRGRNDDGSETAATWIDVANANWTQVADEVFRVRFLIEETAGGSANSYSYVLQYNINGAGWVTQGVTGPVHSTASAFVTDATATTQQLGAGTFVAGEFDSDAGASNISLSSQQTEMEYSVLLDSALISNNDVVQLRVSNSGTAINGYTNTPSITASVAVTTTGTGVVEAQSSSTAGAGSIGRSATGDVQASDSSTTGEGIRLVKGTGSAEATSSTVQGSGGAAVGVTGTGVVLAQDAVIAGTGYRKVTGIGSSTASLSITEGLGSTQGSIQGIGVLSAQVSAVQGIGTRGVTGIGVVPVLASEVQGTGVRSVLGSGSILAGNSKTKGYSDPPAATLGFLTYIKKSPTNPVLKRVNTNA